MLASVHEDFRAPFIEQHPEEQFAAAVADSHAPYSGDLRALPRHASVDSKQRSGRLVTEPYAVLIILCEHYSEQLVRSAAITATFIIRFYADLQIEYPARHTAQRTLFISEVHFTVLKLVLPVCAKLSYRSLAKPSLFEKQFSRYRHLSEYAGARCAVRVSLTVDLSRMRRIVFAFCPDIFKADIVCVLRILHPAYHYASAVRSCHDLRRIKIKAQVYRIIPEWYASCRIRFSLRIRSKSLCFFVVVPAYIADIVAFRKPYRADGFLFFQHHVHRAGDQYLSVLQAEKAWTFPHHAYAALIPEQHLVKSPVKPIIAPVQTDLSAVLDAVCVLGYDVVKSAVCRDRPVCAVRSPPHIRIAELVCVASCRQIVFRDDRIAFVFAVFTRLSRKHRDALRLPPPSFAKRIKAVVDTACVHQKMSSVRHGHRRA